jgi:hypothetical protein
MPNQNDQPSGFWAALFAGVNMQDIGLVALGGAIGGVLQPILIRFDPSRQNPDGWNFLLGPLLGIAAAGISVFVLANSKTEDKLRLLFFSLLCGLAFPSVLTSAVDTLDPKSQAVERKADMIAATAAKGKTDQAANELTSAMAQNPASVGIEQVAQQKLEVSANAVEGESAEAIARLKRIGTTARDSGYDGVALRVTEELKKLESSTSVDAVSKEDAGQAADAVIGVRLMDTPEAK